jgi:hypothetical protein
MMIAWSSPGLKSSYPEYGTSSGRERRVLQILVKDEMNGNNRGLTEPCQ